MPKSEIEIKIDKCTNENNVSEDWGLIMDIVDQINHSSSKKEIIKIFIRKLNDKDPHVIEHTITLLNACVSNCDRTFKLEVCSRIFIEELRNFILKKRFEKLSKMMANTLEKWTKEAEFKNDPALNLVPTLYMELKRQGVDFGSSDSTSTQSSSSKVMKQDLLEKREEEELEKAIQLSLKESQSQQQLKKSNSGGGGGGSAGGASSSLFGQLMQSTQSISDSYQSSAASSSTTSSNKKRRVKALYDFEAAEDNEITFKAGDILFLSDDSDPNWWKGFDMTGTEGLFPSNFVTFDLNEKIEVFDSKAVSKKVSFNDNVDVNLIQNADVQARKTIVIDEKKIDECIEMLQNADPTGEIQPDSQEMLELEDECYMMGPLIDKKLQEIDEQHAALEDLNLKLLEAFQLYNNLMKESISKQTALITSSMSNSATAAGILNSASLAAHQQQPAQLGATGPAGMINYSAAPPSLDANSLNFANKLNSFMSSTPPASAFNGSAYSNSALNPNFAASSISAAVVGPSMNMPGGYGTAGPNPNLGGLYMGTATTGAFPNPSNLPATTNGTAPNIGSSQPPQMATYGNFN